MPVDTGHSDPVRGGIAPGDARHHHLRIRRILERRITPSLILDPSKEIPSGGAADNGQGQSDALVAMALQGREAQARTELRALYEEGMGFDRMQLGLLAPAADKLGALWENDSLSFVDVTIATGTLQRLMHFVAIDLETMPPMGEPKRAMLMVQEPGAEHTMGASMAVRFFERAGWHVDYKPGAARSALIELIRSRSYDVLSLSIAVEDKVASAARLLRELRTASRNRGVVTLGGGGALVRDPLLVNELGLDAVATAIAGAPDALAQLVRARNAAP